MLEVIGQSWQQTMGKEAEDVASPLQVSSCCPHNSNLNVSNIAPFGPSFNPVQAPLMMCLVGMSMCFVIDPKGQRKL